MTILQQKSAVCTSQCDQTKNRSITHNAIVLSNEDFLKGIFGSEWERAHVTSFKEDPYDLDKLNLRHYWGGDAAGNKLRYCLKDRNTYFTISLFNLADDGRARRRKDLHDATYVITIDDVHDKVPAENIKDLPEPSYKLETSPGNEQWGYILETPETRQERVDALLNGLVAAGIADDMKDPGMKGVTRYVRMPVGSNTKAKYGKPFECCLKSWHPDRVYRLEDLAGPFSIDVTNVATLSKKYGAGIPESSDPVVSLLSQAGLLRGNLKPDTYDMECPWVAEHTGAADSGAAYLSPFAFKCHHGHCEDRHFGDLIDQLEILIPGAKKAVDWAQMVHDFDENNRWPFDVAQTWKSQDMIKTHAGWLLHLKVLDPLEYESLINKWDAFGVVTPEHINELEVQAVKDIEKSCSENEQKAHQAATVVMISAFGDIDDQQCGVLVGACRTSVAEYERQRNTWASDLGVRKAVLDDMRTIYQREFDRTSTADDGEDADDGKPGSPLTVRTSEPAADKQNGPILFDDLRQHIAKYVVAEPAQHVTMALYSLFSHAHQQGLYGLAPKLAFLAPTREAGKTTAASTIAALGGASIAFIDATGATMFRAFEQVKIPFTMFLDEFDAKVADMPEAIRAILNAGYDVETAKVPRCAGDDFEVREFNCYGPQVYCAIGKVPDTVASRSLLIQMRRAGRGDTYLPRYSLDEARKQTEAILAGRAARWVEDNITEIKNRLRTVPVPDLGSPRRMDNWRPLFAICDVLFGTVPDEIINTAYKISEAGTDRGDRVSMLMDDLAKLVVGIFGPRWQDRLNVSPRPGLPTSLILDYLLGLDARPWSGWAHGQSMTHKHMANILSPIGVSSTEIGAKGYRSKGYPLDALKRAFDIYVADMPSSLDAEQKREIRDAVSKSSGFPLVPWPASWDVEQEAKL
jgi:hypothetical protein